MNKRIFYIVLGSVLFLLLGSSVYINFIAKNPNVINTFLLIQILLGLAVSIFTLYMGSSILVNRKNYEVMLISFLEVLFTLVLVILNIVYGYRNVVSAYEYSYYMEYVSMYMNVYLYGLFAFVMGLLTLNSFITYKVKN